MRGNGIGRVAGAVCLCACMTTPLFADAAAAAAADEKAVGYKALGAADPDEWPSFHPIPGSRSMYRVSGSAEFDLLHDTGRITTPSALVTDAIVTNPQSGETYAPTHVSFQASRVSLETRTPLSDDWARRVTTYFAWDLFDNMESTAPALQLLQAYAEIGDVSGSGGNLLLGRSWTTFTNLYAVPDTLEFQGPNAIFGLRRAMVRWTQHFADGIVLKVAAEEPGLCEYDDANGSDASGTDATAHWPDGVITVGWERPRVNLLASYLARVLGVKSETGQTAFAYGWGASLQGRFGLSGALAEDFVVFMLTYGEGIGSLMNDAPPDAFYDPETNRLQPIGTFGTVVGYQHRWNARTYSVATYGYLKQDTLGGQAGDAYALTRYATANYCWTPDRRWLFGGALTYGYKQVKDGSSGSDVRTILTARFYF